MKDELIAWIGSIVILIGIIVGIIFLYSIAENAHDNKLWNNGHCECGGTWEYEQAVGHRSYTSYIYVCDKCGERIEMYNIVR